MRLSWIAVICSVCGGVPLFEGCARPAGQVMVPQASTQEQVEARCRESLKALSDLKDLLAENAALEQQLKDMRGTADVGTQEMRKQVSSSLVTVLLEIERDIEAVRQASARLQEEITSHGDQSEK